MAEGHATVLHSGRYEQYCHACTCIELCSVLVGVRYYQQQRQQQQRAARCMHAEKSMGSSLGTCSIHAEYRPLLQTVELVYLLQSSPHHPLDLSVRRCHAASIHVHSRPNGGLVIQYPGDHQEVPWDAWGRNRATASLARWLASMWTCVGRLTTPERLSVLTNLRRIVEEMLKGR